MTTRMRWFRSAIPATRWALWAVRSGDVALLDWSLPGRQWRNPRRCAAGALEFPRFFGAGSSRARSGRQGARARLAEAGIVFVDADLAGLFDLNGKVSFPFALHEPIADFPAYLNASGIEGVTLAEITAQIASPDVKGAFGAIVADAFGAAYDDAISVQRPALQKLYAAYFRDNNVDAILFPTTVAPAVAIDMDKGSGEVSLNGGTAAPTFNTLTRNTDPGSNAGIPGLSLFAGMARGSLHRRPRNRRPGRQRRQPAKSRPIYRIRARHGAAAAALASRLLLDTPCPSMPLTRHVPPTESGRVSFGPTSIAFFPIPDAHNTTCR